MEQPKLKGASKRLRRLCDRLAGEGTPFVELPASEASVWGPRYVARTRVGDIRLEFNGRWWVLSLAARGARHFASNEDWFELLYGKTFGGYNCNQDCNITWINHVLDEGLPQMETGAIDEVVERRLSKPPMSGWRLPIFLSGSLLLSVAMFVVAYYLRSGAAGTAAALLFATWLGVTITRVRESIRRRRLTADS